MKLYKLKPLTSGGKPLPEDIAVDTGISIDGLEKYTIERWSHEDGPHPQFKPYHLGLEEFDTFAEAVAWIEQDRIARVEALCDVVDVPN